MEPTGERRRGFLIERTGTYIGTCWHDLRWYRRFKKAWKLTLLIALFLPFLAFAEDAPALTNAYVGKVLSVHDGDTVNVEILLGFDLHLTPVAIRLFTVFAPELGHPGGAAATAKLKELLPAGAPIVLRPVMTANASPNHEIMTFQRYVARIWRKDLDICEEMNRFLAAPSTDSGPSTPVK